MIHLRDDDRLLLTTLASLTGLGRVYSFGACGRSRPSAAWVVYRQGEMADAVRLLDAAGLRGRKRREYLVWREAALEFAASRSAGRKRDHALVARAAQQVKAMRVYRPPRAPISEPGRHELHQQACIDVLRTAARDIRGLVTVTEYARARRGNPDWPDRNTIARAFGTWAAALEAAGLGSRCSGRARAGRPATRTPSAADDARREACRARVLDAVAALARDQRRPPTVHEFFEWRASHDTTLPSIATTYRLFPDGWSSVFALAEARARATELSAAA